MKTDIEQETAETSFLDEAERLVCTLLEKRRRLGEAMRQRAELLASRDEALLRGEDVLPKVRELHAEIETLPVEIQQAEDYARWLIRDGVARLDNSNDRQAGIEFYGRRRELTALLTRTRQVFVEVAALRSRNSEENERARAAVAPLNDQISDMEITLGGRLERIKAQSFELLDLHCETLRQDGIIAAIDQLIRGLE